MSVLKQQIIDLIEKMPDTLTIDDVIEELCFKMQVDEGMEQLDNGQTLEHDQVKLKLSKWLES